MFPNPQDALPLPLRPSLERYRKLAKEMVKGWKSGDDKALSKWLSKTPSGVEDFARKQLTESGSLTRSQFVIARSYGFQSWPKFSKHLEELGRSSPVSRFEKAADAIVGGDVAAVKRLLREHPKLIRARSTREHEATLLHYVAANGVESYRQKTPKSIVEITEVLLQAGAEIDAEANVYGGGCTTLGLAATSVHPERADVQEALLQILLDHGARMEDPPSAGNKHSLILACLANGQPKAAEFLANRGAPLDLAGAAGIGRLDVVSGLIDEATGRQLDKGFLYACLYGHRDVVQCFLERGMGLAAHGGDGQTPLHMAVIGGHLETVKLLLRHKPPLEAKNVYGGTVWGQTLWSAAHGSDPDRYIAILEVLASAGAKIGERHIPVNPRVDAWLARHGSVAEPSWYWFGEKPRV